MTGASHLTKVLYYNWVDYLDDEARGGGVSIYQANLADAIAKRGDISASFLSAGLSYDLRAGASRWEAVRHGRKLSPRRFEIVNSGVMAPSHHSLGSSAQLSHPATRACFASFLRVHGPFDIVHFNTLEGLPADVLSLREQFPETRFVLSLHNYYPFCPQVNLWFDEAENCQSHAEGAKCIECVPHRPPENLVRMANALAYWLKTRGVRPGTRRFDLVFRTAMRLGRRAGLMQALLRRQSGSVSNMTLRSQAQKFAERRQKMVGLVNEHCDAVLCVSDRVRQIATGHQVRPDLLQTCYIGTKEAHLYQASRPRGDVPGADGTVTLGYLGYMRRDKGFFFLLNALERLPADLAKRIRLVVAARPGPAGAMARLDGLRRSLADVQHIPGYGHGDLKRILAPVDVGLVPVMWEDNLPQVAIEMHARRIPLLTSDLGGARELANCPEMVFRAGQIDSFHARLRFILNGGLDVARYWAGATAPVTMDQHVDTLLEAYRARSYPAALAA